MALAVTVAHATTFSATGTPPAAENAWNGTGAHTPTVTGVASEAQGGTGIAALGTGVATFLGAPSSANLRAALTDETGTGLAYFQGGALGTPSSGTLTNCTGLPLSGLADLTPIKTFIVGGLITVNADTSKFDLSACSFYEPNTGKVLTYAGATAISGGTLNTVSNQWNEVYLWDNAGTATVEVVNNAAPPAAYLGTARQGGTNSGRWIGGFFSNANGAGSIIVLQDAKQVAANSVDVIYMVNTAAAPYLYSVTSSFVEVSLVARGLPASVCSGVLGTAAGTYTATALALLAIATSIDGTNTTWGLSGYVPGTSQYINVSGWHPILAATPSLYMKYTLTSPGVTPSALWYPSGYRFAR